MSAKLINALPGWWGKLPGTGDFSYRRLAAQPRAVLDEWLQAELGALRQRHASWQTAYLGAPLWQFVLGTGLMTPSAWLGVMMPSVDRVGRYFPLVIVQPIEEALSGGWHVRWWWHCATLAALQALREDCDPEGLERALVEAYGSDLRPQAMADDALPLPGAGCSRWCTSAATVPPLLCAGWPRGAHFDLLFDLAGLPATGGAAA